MSQFKATSFTYKDEWGVERQIDLQQHTRLKSRESCGVWVIKNKTWKIFSNTNNYDRLYAGYEKARNNSVPTPEYSFYRGTVAGSGRSRGGFALCATHVSGYFFALDKGTGSFKQVINSITDAWVLWKIEQALQNAINIGLTDPQGFISPTNVDNPIMFIDIHTGSMASGRLTQMWNEVTARRGSIQGH